MGNILDTENHHVKSYQIQLCVLFMLQTLLGHQKLAFSFGLGISWCATDSGSWVVTGKGIFEPKNPLSGNSAAPQMKEQMKGY